MMSLEFFIDVTLLAAYHLNMPIVMESGSLNLQEPSGPVPFNHILYLSLSYPFSYFESHLVCTYIEFIYIISKMEVLITSVL